MHRHGRQRVPAVVLLCTGLALVASSELLAKPIAVTYGATSRVRFDEAVKAKRAPSMDLRFKVPTAFVDRVLAQGATVNLDCTVDAGRKGVKITVGGTVVDPFGRPAAVPPEKARTKKDGTATVSYALPVGGALGGTVELRLTLDPAGPKKITGYTGSCTVQATAR